MTFQPIWITEDAEPGAFPDVEVALAQPNGLLAAGGDLSSARLLCAYRRGIFPWYSRGQPILWWSPDPRTVLNPASLRISRSLRKSLRRGRLLVTLDLAFEQVMRRCAEPRVTQNDTWITSEMLRAYCRLHRQGYAHSVECWDECGLVGGLYGVALGRVFFGESMFSLVPDASKVALAHLCQLGFELVDCQLPSEHLSRLGATALPRREFTRLLERWCEVEGVLSPLARGAWV